MSTAPVLRAGNRDRSIALWIVGGMFALILLFSALGPRVADNDPDPTTYNVGTEGAKAVYLLLPQLGYNAQRWNAPATDLRNVDAARTTLILTEPKLPIKDLKLLRQGIKAFLERGGRVIATGPEGALLLPNGSTTKPTIFNGLCFTKPEGNGALAKAGEVPISVPVRWAPSGGEYAVDQRCGPDAVVVHFRVGQGEAIWWASATPLTNQGLSNDPSLKLTLASIGSPDRTVLFDEYMHTYRETITDTLAGLPWWSLGLQCAAVGVLLLFSFSRRSGPLRTPVTLPRTSPIEFAQSMGHLYHKAGATQAATEAARGRLLDFLREQCGISREQIHGELANALSERFGGNWSDVAQHLEQARDAQTALLSPKSALKLVQSLEADQLRLQQRMLTHPQVDVVHS